MLSERTQGNEKHPGSGHDMPLNCSANRISKIKKSLALNN